MREILVSLGLMLGCGILVLAFQFMSGTPAAVAGSISSPESIAVVSPSTPAPSPSIAMDSAENQVTNALVTTASGLQYAEIVEGTGEMPTKGQTIAVHYTGTLENGKKFDSSRDSGRPFTFEIGENQVIKGWDEGLSTMKVGGRRKLIIPPALGYGARGAGNVIPPNAVLVFDVELLKIK